LNILGTATEKVLNICIAMMKGSSMRPSDTHLSTLPSSYPIPFLSISQQLSKDVLYWLCAKKKFEEKEAARP
jgi:hypothetical protein